MSRQRLTNSQAYSTSVNGLAYSKTQSSVGGPRHAISHQSANGANANGPNGGGGTSGLPNSSSTRGPTNAFNKSLNYGTSKGTSQNFGISRH
jgi:hypothetical protein